jgi:hypothetical protein
LTCVGIGVTTLVFSENQNVLNDHAADQIFMIDPRQENIDTVARNNKTGNTGDPVEDD